MSELQRFTKVYKQSNIFANKKCFSFLQCQRKSTWNYSKNFACRLFISSWHNFMQRVYLCTPYTWIKCKYNFSWSNGRRLITEPKKNTHTILTVNDTRYTTNFYDCVKNSVKIIKEFWRAINVEMFCNFRHFVDSFNFC